MELLVSIFAALGVLLTAVEVLLGFPQLRALYRGIRGAPGAIGQRVDYWAAMRMPAVRPGHDMPPHVLRRRERLSTVRRVAQWLAKTEPKPPTAPRLSYRDRQKLRALGLDGIVEHLERPPRR